MQAYKKNITIKESNSITLSNLPFKKGQKVEIVILVKEESIKPSHINEVKKLFKETQSLTQIKNLSEEDIRLEIEAYHKQK